MRTRRPNEAGSLTIFMTIAAVGLLAAAGLVADGGYLLAARREALTEADGAARAGAQQTTGGAGLGLPVSVDPARAERAARDFLSGSGHQSTVDVEGDRVTVTVRSIYRMRILPAGSRQVTAVGTARAARGS